MKALTFALMATSAILLVDQAHAGLLPGQAFVDPTNLPPPTGNVIDQLTGLPIVGNYQTRTVNFTATMGMTNLSFAFREDPSFLLLDNVTLNDVTHPSGNLVVNGDFEAGPVGSSQPTGWTYLNNFGASFGGVVTSECGNPGVCYEDGAVQAYDSITQAIATTIGDTYHLSYQYADLSPGGSPGVYQPLSTNGDVSGTGGNGRDMFVFAGGIPVRAAPEPASLALLGSGLLGFGLLRRRRK
jgi:hypothetical protein